MDATEATPEFMSQFPPDELAEEELELDLGTGRRCFQKFLEWKGQVVWFSIVAQVRHEGSWRTVARADTCHDEAHIHRMKKRGDTDVEYRKQALRQLNTIQDVGDSFDEACDKLMDDFEENVRRWHG